MCDFESRVYEGEKWSEVWGSGRVELQREKVEIFDCINEEFNYFK